MLGQIKTKSVFDKIEESDGYRLLITRFHPRIKNFKIGEAYYAWLKELAPEVDILLKYKQKEIGEAQLEAWYVEYINSHYNHASNIVTNDLAWIKNQVRNGNNVTLLCFERDGQFCHRHLLKEYLDKVLEAERRPIS